MEGLETKQDSDEPITSPERSLSTREHKGETLLKFPDEKRGRKRFKHKTSKGNLMPSINVN